MSKLIPKCCALLSLLLTVHSPATAVSIAVPNGSFESPNALFGVSINVDSWQKTSLPPGYTPPGGYEWADVVGVFKNTAPGKSDHIDNCDGTQALWVFADSYAGVFQDYDSVDWRNQTHQFNAAYTVGKSYHLTVGVIGTGGGMLPNATFQLSLYYRDASSNQVTVAATTLPNTPSVFSNNTHFVDCYVD